MLKHDQQPFVVVVVATKNRPQLLAQRSLPSVIAQTRAPDQIVVVDDSAPNTRTQNLQTVEALDLQRLTYLVNHRTCGASGSWNTALTYLLNHVGDPQNTFVAILDDDDAWEPTYLEQCLEHPADMVAANIIRHTNDESTTTDAPAQLLADDFLVGNPGIQGSNLFVRLSVLLSAGGFDEALVSTTDRDLCIRLADLGTVHYRHLPVSLVHHYADENRPRLSTKGSEQKQQGLDTFWQKHSSRMNEAQRQAFTARAQALFDWRQPTKYALVLGLEIDRHPQKLIDWLTQWEDDTLVGLDVVLFGDNELAMDTITNQLRRAGVGCFPHQFVDISPETCCAYVASQRTGSQAWLIKKDTPPPSTNAQDALRWFEATRLTTQPDNDHLKILEPWIEQARIETARHRILKQYPAKQLDILGLGSEAVVFTDGRKVYKCIDYWKTRIPQSQIAFLQTQINEWHHTPGLYHIEAIINDGPWVLLVYPYEASTPYQGGKESSMLALLKGCRDVGIVCNNIHPKNLIVTEDGIKLIDYGSDIHAWTPTGFEHMARRAYLSCHHAAHPQLKTLMRQVLRDPHIAEMKGYTTFRSKLKNAQTPSMVLYVGVISSDPKKLEPLLHSLKAHAAHIIILDNGSPIHELEALIQQAQVEGQSIALITMAQQQQDAQSGAFGGQGRPTKQVSIAQARTMLQKYMGHVLLRHPEAYGWLLDDDMRLDHRAHTYLPYLKDFRQQGVDILIGAYEGSSPNPPINGLRVQLVDLYHNLLWLNQLPDHARLPNRREHNAQLRAQYPDYYYDLSRKHTAHLEMPHWIEPINHHETVKQARKRLIDGAMCLLSGAPLTRPIIATMSEDPIGAAKDSVNRGGCTFILNPQALLKAPNIITSVNDLPARRSDMMWAIINRYYHQMTIKAVPFPILHVGRVTSTPSINTHKVQAEIIGSTLYGGLTEFLNAHPDHRLNFTQEQAQQVGQLANKHLTRRWRLLKQSFARIRGLSQSIKHTNNTRGLEAFLGYLDDWFSEASFSQLSEGLHEHDQTELRDFLITLRSTADHYAHGHIDVDFIETQLVNKAT